MQNTLGYLIHRTLIQPASKDTNEYQHEEAKQNHIYDNNKHNAEMHKVCCTITGMISGDR